MSKHEKDFPLAPESGGAVLSFTKGEVAVLTRMARIACVFALGQVKTLPNREDDVRLDAALFYDEAMKLQARLQRVAERL
jgi:hypothetical protein